MTGGTGLVGTALLKELGRRDHQVTLLTRGVNPATQLPAKVTVVQGDPTRPGEWQEVLAGHDAVVSLAGASIFQRWSEDARKVILDSRLLATRNTVDAIARSRRQMTLLSVSGVGYYGSRGDRILAETDVPGIGFLAGVAGEWEAEAEKAEAHGARVLICRLGHVLGKGGGALPKLVALCRRRLGSEWGTGQQWVSWIHEQDLARAFPFLIERGEPAGPFNVCSPKPVRNSELMETINKLVGARSLIPPIPGMLLRALLGEFASVFMGGQRAVPTRLESAGFEFGMPELEPALRDLLGVPDNTS